MEYEEKTTRLQGYNEVDVHVKNGSAYKPNNERDKVLHVPSTSGVDRGMEVEQKTEPTYAHVQATSRVVQAP